VSTIEELLEKKVAAPVYKIEITAVGICHADHVTPSIHKRKFYITFADKWQSLGRYSSLADSGHGVFFFYPCMHLYVHIPFNLCAALYLCVSLTLSVST
jgi:hypothetical protein